MVEALEQLRQRVEVLLGRYQALQAENQTLRERTASQERTIRLLQDRVEALTQGALDRQLARSLPADEREPLRKHLDSVINNIDKILSAIHA